MELRVLSYDAGLRREDLRVLGRFVLVWDVSLDLEVVLVEVDFLGFLVGGDGSSTGGHMGQLSKKVLSFG